VEGRQIVGGTEPANKKYLINIQPRFRHSTLQKYPGVEAFS
jgi:hypothetical protein